MTRPKVLLIGWDAADWKAIHPLIDAGQMPNLRGLIERGAMGRAATLHPALSPMLWTSIATGKRPFKHGIHGFTEPTPDGRGVQPITNLSRTSKAIWNILSQNGLRSTVIGWWPSHPAEPIHGVMVSDHYHKAHRDLDRGWPLLANAVHPPELHETLAELRLHPQELSGPMVAPFLPALEKVDQEKDRRFPMLCKIIAECSSIHNAATWLLDNQPWDFFAVYYDAIDHFCHGFMQFHPPRRPWIGEADFELYSNVVTTAYILHDQMLGTLLRKAGEDTYVILMSDHGFHPDHLRPTTIPDFPAGPAVEHSPYGIFVMAGPGIKKDAPLYGLSVLDLTPTLLALYDLPAGEDMDGRVVTQAFENPPEQRKIASWEDVAPLDGCTNGRHSPHLQLDPVACVEALEQLVALGYIEKPGEDIRVYVENTVRELRFNLLEAYQDAGRHREALEIARDLCRSAPDDQRYALKRFLACQALQLTGEMRTIVDDMDGRRHLYEEALEERKSLRELAKRRYEEGKNAAGETPDDAERDREVAYELNPKARPPAPRESLLNPEELQRLKRNIDEIRYSPAVADLLQAQTLVAEKRWFEALAVLDRVEGANLEQPAIVLECADLLRRLGRLPEAERRYRQALRIDPDNVHAWLGISRVELRRHNYAAAVDAAAECSGRLFFYPLAHFLEGVASIGLEDYGRARECLRLALWQNPHFPQAHLWLARLLKYRLNDRESAADHFQLYREMRRCTAHQPAASPSPSPAFGEYAPPDPPELSKPPVISLPPMGHDVLVVSGLPRSGTSMLMQMIAAGGMPVLTDRKRQADEDNPKGYFEFEAVKNFHADQSWIAQARGKAVKIVAPLIWQLPAGLPCRVILLERDYDGILDSQSKMLARRGESVQDSLERRERLTREYARIIDRTKRLLRARLGAKLLILRYEHVVEDSNSAARAVNSLVGGALDEARMAATVEPSLHRNRAAVPRLEIA